jgi:hypothetical protein
MGFFYKKCEVCGNKIKKCNSMKEYVFGSWGFVCNKCNTNYGINYFIAIFLSLCVLYLLPIHIFLIVTVIDYISPISFGGEIWLIAILIFYIGYRLFIGFLPCHIYKKDKK